MCQRSFFQDRVRQRTFEQLADIPALVLQERLSERIFERAQQRPAEHIVDESISQIMEEGVECGGGQHCVSGTTV